ncbi:MAG: tRNA 2-thiocytidine biosynthesis protein TtcA [Gaiellales bacterium]|nr:tRNA 2-thiocytidine biosynthesis protein TtcA [Gaiellales bacterium]
MTGNPDSLSRFEKAVFYLDRRVSEAVRRFELITNQDRIMVGLSGGKDSLVLLHVLARRRAWRREKYQLIACHVQAGAATEASPALLGRMEAMCSNLGVPLLTVRGEPLPPPEDLRRSLSPCFLCARRRRKRLLEAAQEQGFTKVALGHHKDDVAETVLLNLLWQGRCDTMLPRQPLIDGRFLLIRPLVLVDEKDIARAARLSGFTPTSCSCPYARGSARETAAEIISLARHQGCRGVTSNLLRATEQYGDVQPSRRKTAEGDQPSAPPSSSSRQTGR